MKLHGRKLYQTLLLSLMLLAGGLPAAQAAPEAEGAGDGAAAVDTTVSLNLSLIHISEPTRPY